MLCVFAPTADLHISLIRTPRTPCHARIAIPATLEFRHETPNPAQDRRVGNRQARVGPSSLPGPLKLNLKRRHQRTQRTNVSQFKIGSLEQLLQVGDFLRRIVAHGQKPTAYPSSIFASEPAAPSLKRKSLRITQINQDHGRPRHAPVHPWKLRIMHRLNALAIAMISRLIVPLRTWRFAEIIFGTGGIEGGSQCLHGTSRLQLSRKGKYREVLLYVYGVPLCFGSILLR